jgi:hypothetical protein
MMNQTARSARSETFERACSTQNRPPL